MKKKHKVIDLNRIDWAEIGDMVCSIIATVNQSRARFEKEAAARGTSIEGLMAAAITSMLQEHLEKKDNGGHPRT